MVGPSHIVEVEYQAAGKVRTFTVCLPATFNDFIPLVKLETFALIQHRALRSFGCPVAALRWSARPDPTWKPPKPKQLGLF